MNPPDTPPQVRSCLFSLIFSFPEHQRCLDSPLRAESGRCVFLAPQRQPSGLLVLRNASRALSHARDDDGGGGEEEVVVVEEEEAGTL